MTCHTCNRDLTEDHDSLAEAIDGRLLKPLCRICADMEYLKQIDVAKAKQALLEG